MAHEERAGWSDRLESILESLDDIVETLGMILGEQHGIRGDSNPPTCIVERIDQSIEGISAAAEFIANDIQRLREYLGT